MRPIPKQAITHRVTRFTIAGAINTTVNFTVLNLVFYVLHQNELVSIVIATSCAIAVSFVLNRSFVFMNTERPFNKLVRFVLVSAIGVFLIQNSIYLLVASLLHSYGADVIGAIQQLTSHRLSKSFVIINLSNILASFAVMFWNYNSYKFFVFNNKGLNNEIEDFNSKAS